MKLVCIILSMIVVSLNLAQKTTDPRQQEKQDLSWELLHEIKSMREQLTSMKEEITDIKITMNEEVPCNCLDLKRKGITKNGVYTIYVHTGYNKCVKKPIQVYCDMETDGGGWLVFQRRADGSTEFYREWDDYKYGFGNLTNEFWLGNEDMYQILNKCGNQHELSVDLEDFSNETRFAKYSTFNIESEEDNYRLRIGGYTGNAGDSMAFHNGFQFSTFDKDNDGRDSSCAVTFKGSWWYNSCHHSNLNGRYLSGTHTPRAEGVNWYHWKGYYYSLKFTDMKIRPK